MRGWQGLPDDITPYQGFVYILSFRGKHYIGKKNFWKTVRYPPLKGYKRNRLKRKETDWRSYLGSSEKFLEHIKGHEDEVERRILHLCRTKFGMAYLELQEQMDRKVLFRDEYFNGVINVRLGENACPGENNL